MLLTMFLLTLLTGIIAPLLLVVSCYYSERNFKKGKFYWKASTVIGLIYSISFWITLVMLLLKLLGFIF